MDTKKDYVINEIISDLKGADLFTLIAIKRVIGRLVNGNTYSKNN